MENIFRPSTRCLAAAVNPTQTKNDQSIEDIWSPGTGKRQLEFIAVCTRKISTCLLSLLATLQVVNGKWLNLCQTSQKGKDTYEVTCTFVKPCLFFNVIAKLGQPDPPAVMFI